MLFSLKQARRRVTEYIIDFRMVANDSHWNEEALTDTFFQRVDEIKDELVSKNYPELLKVLEDLAMCIDVRPMERRSEKRGKVEKPSHSWGQFCHTTPKVSLTSVSIFQQAKEPMQLGRSHLTQEKKERRRRLNLCFYCGSEGHSLKMSTKRRDSAGDRIIYRHIMNPKISSPLTLTAKIQLQGRKHLLSVFIDSGADKEFIDFKFTKSLGIKTIPSAKGHKVLVLEGHMLHQTNQEPEPITFSLSGNHHEKIKFLAVKLPPTLDYLDIQTQSPHRLEEKINGGAV